MLANRKVLRAAIGIPLCLLGIILIFGLKPQSGSTITGLAVLTAVVQALGDIVSCFSIRLFRMSRAGNPPGK